MEKQNQETETETRPPSKRYNRIHLRGYCGRDAKLSRTIAGRDRADFSMNSGGGQKAGEWQGEPAKYKDEWHYCIAWGFLAASCHLIKTGVHLDVTGRLTYFTDKDGKLRPQIHCFSIEVNGQNISQAEAHMTPQPVVEIQDDDIPF